MSEMSEIPQEELYKPVHDIFEAGINRDAKRYRTPEEHEDDQIRRDDYKELFPTTFASLIQIFKEPSKIDSALRVLDQVRINAMSSGGVSADPEHWIGTMTSDRGKQLVKNIIEDEESNPETP
ncbi:MAG TPA: hypothetical protein VNW29_07350 [Candidatus Sulfotelmatobacter sp.]|jgi:hypothetical protein|nr:hypothetical protein [Candidatus Sulfotelmatobacter sp.]